MGADDHNVSPMASILESYPEYGETAYLDKLRAAEYSYLDEHDHLYLDYTGSGLAARAQHYAHAERLRKTIFGNPHSINPTSEAATEAVARCRARVLAHFNASAADYAVIFTPNATGAARLVGESYPFDRRMRLVLTADNHNSINGIREFARRGGAQTAYVPVRAPELRVDEADVVSTLGGEGGGVLASVAAYLRMTGCAGRQIKEKRRGLFAYPAQSNFSGVRHPLAWVGLAQDMGYDVLLDAAAYLPTSGLDLSAVRPEFVVASWYKLFGYPTGVGCLVARRDALARLARPWFSGGTIEAVSVGMPWHVATADESAFEDGTVNFLSIPDVHFGLDWFADAGMSTIGTRVRCLTAWFLDGLKRLRHSDGSPMVSIYGPADMTMRGGTVAFNFLDAAGRVVDERVVALESSVANISLRTGCFCNPGVGESAFGIRATSLLRLQRAQTTSIDEYVRLLGLPSAGAIRVSFGIASTAADVTRFFAFATKTYRDRVVTASGLPPREYC